MQNLLDFKPEIETITPEVKSLREIIITHYNQYVITGKLTQEQADRESHQYIDAITRKNNYTYNFIAYGMMEAMIFGKNGNPNSKAINRD